MKFYLKKLNLIFSLKKIFIDSLFISFVLMIVDKNNYLSNIINICGIFPFAIICCFLLLVLWKSKISSIFSNSINNIDMLSLMFFWAVVPYLIFVLLYSFKIYKIIVLSIYFCLYIIYFVRKSKIYNNNEREYRSNTIDLNDILNSPNPISLSSNSKCFIKDEDVAYDLLNRGDTINHLYNSIINCKPEKTFTIGLEGEWGIGKTTIINNVERLMKDNRIIDEYTIIKFDPWKYNDEKSMLNAFINCILNGIDYDIKTKESMKLINNIIEEIFGGKYSFISNIIKNNSVFESGEKFEEIINDYLIKSNKRMIIIIDNLDRIDSDKAVFLINCLETVVNFKRTISILLYDENIMNSILSNKFNSKKNYMSKIVQLRIKVPVTNSYTLDSLKNKIAKKIILDNNELYESMSSVVMKFDNIRQLILFYNVILSYPYNSFNLNMRDDLCLKYIRIVSPKLYYEILNNKNYFVSFDRLYDSDITNLMFDSNEFNKECRNYFDSINGDKEINNYLYILGDMFVSYNNYINGKDPFDKRDDKATYDESISNNRISNARYFDLYFTREENDFTRLNHDVDELICLINNSNQNDIGKYFVSKMSLYNLDELRVFTEILQLNENKISSNKCYDLVLSLLKINNSFADRPLFTLDSLSRIYVLIADLYSNLSCDDIRKLKSYFNDKYYYLSSLENIQHWIEYNEKNGKVYNEDLLDLLNKMCEEVLAKNIDIFNKKNYNHKNIWTVYRHCKTDFERIKNYLNNVVNDKNIFNFLSSLITTSYGKTFGYRISKEKSELIDCVDVSDLLKAHKTSLSEHEKLILEIYKFSMNSNDDFESYEIDDYIKF